MARHQRKPFQRHVYRMKAQCLQDKSLLSQVPAIPPKMSKVSAAALGDGLGRPAKELEGPRQTDQGKHLSVWDVGLSVTLTGVWGLRGA